MLWTASLIFCLFFQSRIVLTSSLAICSFLNTIFFCLFSFLADWHYYLSFRLRKSTLMTLGLICVPLSTGTYLALTLMMLIKIFVLAVRGKILTPQGNLGISYYPSRHDMHDLFSYELFWVNSWSIRFSFVENFSLCALRTSEPHNTGCQKLEASNVNEAIRRGVKEIALFSQTFLLYCFKLIVIF